MTKNTNIWMDGITDMTPFRKSGFLPLSAESGLKKCVKSNDSKNAEENVYQI